MSETVNFDEPLEAYYRAANGGEIKTAAERVDGIHGGAVVRIDGLNVAVDKIGVPMGYGALTLAWRVRNVAAPVQPETPDQIASFRSACVADAASQAAAEMAASRAKSETPVDPHRPVEGVTLWGDEWCSIRSTATAAIKIDDEWAGSYRYYGDNVITPESFADDFARKMLPRRVWNPNHKLSDLIAFRDKVRAERAASRAKSETPAPTRMATSYMLNPDAYVTATMKQLDDEDKAIDTAIAAGKTTPLTAEMLDPPAPAEAEKPGLVVGQWYQRKLFPDTHFMFMVDGAGLLWRKEFGVSLLHTHEPRSHERVNLADLVSRGEYVPAPAVPSPEGGLLDAETWPKGMVWVRHEDWSDGIRVMVIDVNTDFVRILVAGEFDEISFREMARMWQLSLDGGETFWPCTPSGVSAAKAAEGEGRNG